MGHAPHDGCWKDHDDCALALADEVLQAVVDQDASPLVTRRDLINAAIADHALGGCHAPGSCWAAEHARQVLEAVAGALAQLTPTPARTHGPADEVDTAGVRELAERVYHTACRGEWEHSVRLFTELGDRYGATGVYFLLQATADTMGHDQGLPPGAAGAVVQPTWRADSGEVSDADGVGDPDIVWAGQFIAARLAMDRQQCDALIAACPDSATLARRVQAVMMCAAETHRQLRSGL